MSIEFKVDGLIYRVTGSGDLVVAVSVGVVGAPALRQVDFWLPAFGLEAEFVEKLPEGCDTPFGPPANPKAPKMAPFGRQLLRDIATRVCPEVWGRHPSPPVRELATIVEKIAGYDGVSFPGFQSRDFRRVGDRVITRYWWAIHPLFLPGAKAPAVDFVLDGVPRLEGVDGDMGEGRDGGVYLSQVLKEDTKWKPGAECPVLTIVEKNPVAMALWRRSQRGNKPPDNAPAGGGEFGDLDAMCGMKL